MAGPFFGLSDMLDEIADSTERFMFSGERMRVPAHPGIAEIPIVGPTPLYPWAILWNRRSRHPAFPRLMAHVAAAFLPFDPARHWLPAAETERRFGSVSVS